MVTFKQSMSVSNGYLGDEIEKWEILESIYDKYNESDKNAPIIPKIIHQIWIGGDLPPMERKLCNDWKLACEENGWEYILWNDKKLSQLDFLNEDKIFETKSVGQKSDIIRLELLKKYGGVYLDTDFAFVKMFDDKILSLDFFVGLTFDKKPVLMNSIIGSTKDNKILNQLLKIENIKYNNVMDVIASTGPYYITDIYYKNIIENSCVFPVTYFFPFSNKTQDRNKGLDYTKYIKSETYCVHLWNCSWMKK